jgi:hypothetical protein
MSRTTADIIEIGRELIEVRKLCGHGNRLDVDKNTLLRLRRVAAFATGVANIVSGKSESSAGPQRQEITEQKHQGPGRAAR